MVFCYQKNSFSTIRTSKPARHKNSGTKKTLELETNGQVLWFNVRRGYGFIHRDDQDTDIFVHQTAITKNNPNKFLRSVAQGLFSSILLWVFRTCQKPQTYHVRTANQSRDPSMP